MLIYLCPALIDLIGFLALFAVAYGAGERGMTMAQCAWLGGIFQIVYMLISLAAGLVLTRRNARIILLVSIVLSMAGISGTLLIKEFVPLLVAMGIFGVCFALFFNSFQTFMRGEAPPGSLVLTTGLYTLAWSGGSSIGFIASGALYRQGAPMLALVTFLVGLAVLVILVRHHPRPQDTPSAEEPVEISADDVRVRDRYVWVAWVIIFATMFAQRPILTFFPAICAQQNVPAAMTSLPLFLHMLIQALFGICMVRLPAWLYRRWPLLVVQGGAALLLGLVWLRPQFSVAAVAIALLGIWTGFAYFSAVFYASNAGNRSRNIGVNEFLVGLGSSAGLFLSEAVMNRPGAQSALYLVCASAVMIAALAQVLIAGGSRRPAMRGAARN